MRRAFVLGFVLAFFLPATLLGYAVPMGSRYRIYGKKLTYLWDKKVVIVEGDAEITGGGYRIMGDKLYYNYATGEVRSRGRVVIERSDMNFEGENLWFDLKRDVGYVENGRYFSKTKGFYGKGRRIVKLSNGDIWVEDGTFTNCDPLHPAWKVGGKEVVLKKKGYVVIKGLKIYVKNKKVLSLPYGVLPMEKKRKSGFLMPKYGSSTRSGFYFEDQFYYVINRSMDMTFLGGYEGRRGVKLGSEYRYNLGEGKNGILQALYSSGNKKWESKEDRWGVRGDFEWNWRRRDMTLLGDFFLVSDNDFIPDFSGDFITYPTDKRSIDNTIFLRKKEGPLTFTGDLIYFDRLDGSNTDTFSYYPELSARWEGLFKGFDTEASMGFTRFSRDKGYEGYRTSGILSFSRDLNVMGLGTRIFFGGKASYYNMDRYSDDSIVSSVAYGGLELKHDLTYEASFKDKPLLTIITPFSSIFYISHMGKTPTLDGTDDPLYGLYLLYGFSVSSYLSGVRAVEFRVYQAARLDDDMPYGRNCEISLDFLTESDLRVFERTTGKKLSEVVAELSFSPFSDLSVDMSGSVDPYNTLFRRGEVSFNFHHGPFSFYTGYYYLRDVSEELSFGSSFSLLGKLLFSGYYSYLISKHSGQTKTLSLTYSPGCYFVNGYVKSTTRPNETKYGFSVGVKTFGGGVKSFGFSP